MSTRRGFPEPLPPEKGQGGAFRTVFCGKRTHTHGEKTVEVTFHTCVYKKSLRNFFKSGGFNQNGGYLPSHCDAVPSA